VNDGEGRRRATVHDVARQAGVSLATVDRVLNGRPGVRPETIRKVEDAIQVLDFSRDLSASLLARARDLNIRFLIPSGSNEFMARLEEAIGRQARQAAAERVGITSTPIRALDSRDLVAKLDALEAQSCDCVVIVATEDAAVQQAVEQATRRGITVMTLVSDLPGSVRRAFIGIDNIAAGRTAASLLGRFLPQGGKVGVVAGSLGLRDHRERLEGFVAVLRTEFPGLVAVGPVEGHDEASETGEVVQQLLSAHPDLAGLYNLGAGNIGLIRALEDAGRAGSLRVIAHELTPSTSMGLASGAIDVVLDQDPEGEIRAAIAAARQHASGALRVEDGARLAAPIAIGIFLRDNLR
jgi:LacI family transcriptional regulator